MKLLKNNIFRLIIYMILATIAIYFQRKDLFNIFILSIIAVTIFDAAIKFKDDY